MRARTTSIVADGAINSAGRHTICDAPHAVNEQGTARDQVNLRWPSAASLVDDPLRQPDIRSERRLFSFFHTGSGALALGVDRGFVWAGMVETHQPNDDQTNPSPPPEFRPNS
jgi:hypothetical protein